MQLKPLLPATLYFRKSNCSFPKDSTQSGRLEYLGLKHEVWRNINDGILWVIEIFFEFLGHAMSGGDAPRHRLKKLSGKLVFGAICICLWLLNKLLCHLGPKCGRAQQVVQLLFTLGLELEGGVVGANNFETHTSPRGRPCRGEVEGRFGEAGRSQEDKSGSRRRRPTSHKVQSSHSSTSVQALHNKLTTAGQQAREREERE
eukprot:c16120_g1_i1 orf=512-1117(+)